MKRTDQNRRDVLKKLSLGGALLMTGSCTNTLKAAASSTIKESQINHSVCQWCAGFISIEELCVWANNIGLKAIDLIAPKDWHILKKYNIHCSMCYIDGKVSLTEGWNNKNHHASLVADYLRSIPMVKEAGYTNLICFSGNRNGMDDETGMKNAEEGLKKILGLAEKNGVIIQLELFNSKVDHPDYMADKSAWGIELCKRVGSPNLKLLYDIYHMQINEGDVIRTIRDNHLYFGHYHTAGVPGRQNIDQSQELYYPAIMKAIIETGFEGYVAQEFLPRGSTNEEKLMALKQGIEICNV